MLEVHKQVKEPATNTSTPTADTSGSANTSTTPTDTNEAEYLASVERCKAAIADISKKQWVLGDEADKVEKRYGKNRLEHFARDIDFPGEPSTLGRYRDVCRAWPKNRGRPRFFASAQLLATHKDRFGIVERNPNISVREAREIIRKCNAGLAGAILAEAGDGENTEPTATTQEEDIKTNGGDNNVNSGEKGAKAKGAKKEASGERKPEWLRNIEGWFNNQVTAANAVTNELNTIMEKCNPEQRKQLATLEPTLLLDAAQSLEKKSAEFVDWIDTPLEEAADALNQKRTVVTPAPKRTRRAAKPVQPGA
jgi:hypothetical protein